MRVIQDLSSEVGSKVKSLSRVRLFATPWTVTYQAPLSMWFSRQEYWSGLPFPSPGNLPDPGIKPRSPTLQVELYHLIPGMFPSRSLISALYNVLLLLWGQEAVPSVAWYQAVFLVSPVCVWPPVTGLTFLKVDFLIQKLGIIMVSSRSSSWAFGDT